MPVLLIINRPRRKLGMIPKVKEIKALAGGKKLIGKLCAQGFQFVLCILNGNRKNKKTPEAQSRACLCYKRDGRAVKRASFYCQSCSLTLSRSMPQDIKEGWQVFPNKGAHCSQILRISYHFYCSKAQYHLSKANRITSSSTRDCKCRGSLHNWGQSNSDLPKEHQCPQSLPAPGTSRMEIYSLGA